METDVKFNVLLRQLRVEKGLSQKQLAKEVGIANTTISDYETGKYLPNTEYLSRFSDFFNVDFFKNLTDRDHLDDVDLANQLDEVNIEHKDEEKVENMDLENQVRKFNPEGIMFMIVLCLLTSAVFISSICTDNKLFVCALSGILIFICGIYSFLLNVERKINQA